MRRTSRCVFPLSLAAVALAACADTPTAVVDPGERLASVTTDGSAATSGVRHLVLFKKSAPAGFEASVAALGGTVVLNHAIGVAVVDGLDAAGAATLAADAGTSHVVPDGTYGLVAPAAISVPEPVEIESAADPTTAILYANQWNMHQIDAASAWAAGRLGSPDVTIAILDTGIDYLLPDLVGRVDLSRSVSFEPTDDAYAAFYFPGRHPSTDLHYHGTNVATQASSNAWAFAGVTSQTTLMSVKVCSFLGGCHGVTQGILHAIDNGADVINMSLGGTFAKSDFPGAVSFYGRIMNYAKQNGVTMVVSAGNESADLQHNADVFKTYCDGTHVICVSATRRNDVPAGYTNYGRSAIDVAAPGGVSGEWVYSLCPQTSLLFNCASGYFVLGVAGTSQAAPHVSGLAALAVEDVGRDPAKVRAYIRNSADAIGGGNTPFYGKGRINVGRAVGATN